MNLGKIQPPTISKSGKTQKIKCEVIFRGGSRTVATSKMEHFVIIVNGWKPLTIITKRSILDVAVVLDPSIFDVIMSFLLFSLKFIFSSEDFDRLRNRHRNWHGTIQKVHHLGGLLTKKK